MNVQYYKRDASRAGNPEHAVKMNQLMILKYFVGDVTEMHSIPS